MTIGERLSYFRKKQGLTQSALAKKLGITDKAVSKWERNVSCPDISLLSDVAKALGITVDELLQGEDANRPKPNEVFISLEKYLKGVFGYVVPDLHPAGEEIVLVMDYPDKDDAQHGYALSGLTGAEVNKYLFGNNLPFTHEELRRGKLGVTYISNVPLWNLDSPINKLVDELEYTRLNKYHINLFIMEECIKKFSELVLNDGVKIIALTREFNQKYFGAFISYARADILSTLQNKISTGRLKIVYVGPPRFWNKDDYNKPNGLKWLKENI